MDETEHESQPKEPTITFDNGVTLTLSQYNEYIEQQLAWLESLPPISPDSPWCGERAREEDADEPGTIEPCDALDEENWNREGSADADSLVQQPSHSPK